VVSAGRLALESACFAHMATSKSAMTVMMMPLLLPDDFVVEVTTTFQNAIRSRPDASPLVAVQ
jgi:hypothetical protein